VGKPDFQRIDIPGDYFHIVIGFSVFLLLQC
jgi:hypothetical protein